MSEALRWISIVSRGGTTMEAVALAAHNGELKGLVKPVLVVSTRENVDGIGRAEALGIPTKVLPRKDFAKGSDGVRPYGDALLEVLREHAPDVITLNGCLVQMSEAVIYEYQRQLFNQHPGDPRLFGGEKMYGKRVHAATILFARLSGRDPAVTPMVAQRVDPEYDRGPVVKAMSVPILRSDTVDSLQERALPIEYQVQIGLLQDVFYGRVQELSEYGGMSIESPEDQHILDFSLSAGKVLYP